MTGTSSAAVIALAHLVRHAFQQHDIRARILQSLRGLKHGFRPCPGPALHLEAADLVHRLWLQTDMCADGYIVTRQVFNDFNLPITAFQLHHHRAAFLHQAYRVIECDAGLCIAHKWHVGDQECAPQTARNGARVIDNVV